MFDSCVFLGIMVFYIFFFFYIDVDSMIIYKNKKTDKKFSFKLTCFEFYCNGMAVTLECKINEMKDLISNKQEKNNGQFL